MSPSELEGADGIVKDNTPLICPLMSLTMEKSNKHKFNQERMIDISEVFMDRSMYGLD